MSEYSYLVNYLSYLWNNALLVLLSTEAITQIYKGYRISKDYKVKDINKIVSPKLELESKRINLRKEISFEEKKEINKFIKVLLKNFDLSVLTNFYNNINRLKVEISNSYYRSTYNANDNTIRYNYLPVIYHELFHMSSTYFDNHEETINCYSGFTFMEVKNFKIYKVGIGLTEGYTELMTERYFEEFFKKVLNPYFIEKSVASQVEKIVGKSLMERLYLTANLKGLIDELNKYKSEEEIAQFLTNFDFIVKYFRTKCWLDNIKIEKIRISLINMYNFLISAYINKLKEELNNKTITTDDFLKLSFEYIKSFSNYFVFNGIDYQILAREDLNKVFDDLNDYITSYYLKNETNPVVLQKRAFN